jgi:hypothetical protein
MDVVCCDIRVVSSRKRRGERVGVGSRGKYPGAPPHHKGKRNQADRKRYLIGLLGEKGKAKKKKNLRLSRNALVKPLAKLFLRSIKLFYCLSIFGRLLTVPVYGCSKRYF